MATLDDLADGYVSAEDDDYVPESGDSDSDSDQEGHKSSDQPQARTRGAALFAPAAGAAKTAVVDELAPRCDAVRERAAAAWAAMKSTEQVAAGTVGASARPKKRDPTDILANLNKPNKASQQKTKQVLANILGPNVARKRPRVEAPGAVALPGTAAATSSAAPPKAATTDKVIVKQVVQYAGKSMEVAQAVSAVQQPRGLAAVVAALGDPKRINTVEKSAMDWGTFKVQEGIEHELEQQTKDGFVEKQEFLHRVAAREQDLERSKRIEERMAREAAAGKNVRAPAL